MRCLALVLLAASALATPSLAGPNGTPKTVIPRPPADAALAAQQTSAPPDADADPYLWLEDVSGERSMAWVREHNARTLAVLEKDPRFEGLFAEALKIAEAKDRIPGPGFQGGQVYNFWQDAEHVRGVLRRTSLASYETAQPAWETVLDLDALAKAENANWVFKGFTCLQPEERRCLISLSDGGEDAVTVREFDLVDKAFVPGGFTLPKGKQRVAFESMDSVLVARDWGPGTMTPSSYPFIVKRVRRGGDLASAQEVFRGKPDDGGYGVAPSVLVDGQGNRAVLIVRTLTTFESETYLLTPRGPEKLDLPTKARVDELVAGRLLARLDEAWAPGAGQASVPAGALVAFDLKAVQAAPGALRPTVVWSPGPRESLEGVTATKDQLLVSTLDNVRGRAWRFTPTAGGGWRKSPIALPDNASVGLGSADLRSERAFLSVTGFLTPTSLWLSDGATGALKEVKTSPARFDASRDVVEQFEATSTDGTKIPYFVVHPKDAKLDGSNPTIIDAYGGFQVSRLPGYNPTLGKLWLERGGVYVLANIRGGGEFGPAWHEAGLKTKRQVIYDDFAAVAQDLIRRGFTSPRRLGIEGGSNGGLLMGVEMTQHPELWNAVSIGVPLLDMIRIGKIAAGSSWQGEYGDVDADPAVKAFWLKTSPYHNLKAGVRYPEPFIWTTTKDDRVGPQHARKFAAKMEAMGLPFYFYEVTEGGHGAGANLKESTRTQALMMTYFMRKLMD